MPNLKEVNWKRPFVNQEKILKIFENAKTNTNNKKKKKNLKYSKFRTKREIYSLI